MIKKDVKAEKVLIPKKNSIEAKAEYSSMPDEWKRFARSLTKSPFVKKFLYQKYGGRCAKCGKEIKDIEKMHVHHLSYQNYCNFTESIEVVSKAKRKRIVPDCEKCMSANETQFEKCMSFLAPVHSICNKKINDEYVEKNPEAINRIKEIKEEKKKQKQIKKVRAVECDSITIELNEVDKLFESYRDSIFIVVAPSCRIQDKMGWYRISLIYRGYRKVYCGEIKDITSANKCALHGIIDAASHITAGKDIVLLVAGNFGFKKAQKYKGENIELWNKVFTIIESKGCKKITEVVVKDGGAKILSICKE